MKRDRRRNVKTRDVRCVKGSQITDLQVEDWEENGGYELCLEVPWDLLLYYISLLVMLLSISSTRGLEL
jgi:hypothetical protein